MPGPTLVVACVACRASYLRESLHSGNTFGARCWTDGYQHAAMPPDTPPITPCAKCAAFFWVDGAPEIGVFEPWDATPPPIAKGARKVRWLKEPEYAEALASGHATTPDRERVLRVYAWWTANTPRRKRATAARDADTEARVRANLERPAAMLDVDDARERLTAAATARELGRFDAAAELLARAVPPGYERVGAFIAELAAKCDDRVRELTERASEGTGESGNGGNEVRSVTILGEFQQCVDVPGPC